MAASSSQGFGGQPPGKGQSGKGYKYTVPLATPCMVCGNEYHQMMECPEKTKLAPERWFIRSKDASQCQAAKEEKFKTRKARMGIVAGQRKESDAKWIEGRSRPSTSAKTPRTSTAQYGYSMTKNEKDRFNLYLQKEKCTKTGTVTSAETICGRTEKEE